MAIAMALHNIPEVCLPQPATPLISLQGLAVAAAIFEATGRRARAVVTATLTGLVEPISAVLSVAILEQFLSQVG
jgi:ZIP family zinc transporter